MESDPPLGADDGDVDYTREYPTNIGITRGTHVVVSDGVDIWVALRFSYHLYIVSTPGQVLE